jgi:methionyl aminopeptidase
MPVLPTSRQKIPLKTERELDLMRRAGRIVALTLQRLAAACRPGVATADLDRLAEASVRAVGAAPSFKSYRGYPASLCVSINEEVVHGIPGPRRLKSGDLVSLDLGATLDGLIADAALTLGVGEVSPPARRLLDVTREALARAVQQARPGRRVSDISAAIQRHVEDNGCSVVRQLVGHGVGRQMHEPPQIPGFVEGGPSPLLRPGMTLAIEPMVNAGDFEIELAPDGWTYRTRDGSLSAHFEHTVLVSEGEPELLTQLPPEAEPGKRG